MNTGVPSVRPEKSPSSIPTPASKYLSFLDAGLALVPSADPC